MPLTVLVGVGAVALAVPILWWSVFSARAETSQAISRNLSKGLVVNDLRQLLLAQSAAERAVRPTVRRLADRARRLTPVGWVEALQRRIVLAGAQARWPLERVLVGKLLLGSGGAVLSLLVFRARPSTSSFALGVLFTLFAYFVPDLLLYSRSQERQKAVRKALPDTLDQVTISVEAGLGFEAALARAARSGRGPLAEELVRTLQEIQIGEGRARALRNLVERTEVGDLRHFVLAVLQAENYGVPISQVLRIQAAELRTKRRQEAEERAMKVPVKIIFPLAFCIFPSLFIVILGPAMIRIYRALIGNI